MKQKITVSQTFAEFGCPRIERKESASCYIVCRQCGGDLIASVEHEEGLIVHSGLENIMVEPCEECLRRAVERSKPKSDLYPTSKRRSS